MVDLFVMSVMINWKRRISNAQMQNMQSNNKRNYDNGFSVSPK